MAAIVMIDREGPAATADSSAAGSSAEAALLVARALAGDGLAARSLVVLVLPVVQTRIARVLARRSSRKSRDVRQEVEDLAQEVFASLFEKDGRVLRAWDPARGLSLASFCGLIAEREASSILRSGRRSPWTEDATEAADLEKDVGAASGPDGDVELSVASREHLERLTERLREELSPLGLEMFQRLIVEEESVETVCVKAKMKPDAVYAWRSRLAKLARKLAKELIASEPNLAAAAAAATTSANTSALVTANKTANAPANATANTTANKNVSQVVSETATPPRKDSHGS